MPGGARLPITPVARPPSYRATRSAVSITPVVVLASAILDHQLQRTLRDELGLSYAAGATYERLDDDTAHVVLRADHTPGRAAEAGEAMVSALRQIAESGPAVDHLERVRAATREGAAHRDRRVVGLAALERAAQRRLLGKDVPAPEELIRQFETLSAQDVAAAVARMAWTAIMLAPPHVRPTAMQFHAYPNRSSDIVPGTTLARRLSVPGGAAPGTRLLVGEHGVSLVDQAQRPVTVWFARCAAVLGWSDGRRSLIGEDGMSLTILPQEWEFSERLIDAIDRGVPTDRFVPMSPVGPSGELTCQVCGRLPAIALRLRCVTGMIVLYSIRREDPDPVSRLWPRTLPEGHRRVDVDRLVGSDRILRESGRPCRQPPRGPASGRRAPARRRGAVSATAARSSPVGAPGGAYRGGRGGSPAGDHRCGAHRSASGTVTSAQLAAPGGRWVESGRWAR